jgi:hypothetical protein
MPEMRWKHGSKKDEGFITPEPTDTPYVAEVSVLRSHVRREAGHICDACGAAIPEWETRCPRCRYCPEC